MKQYYPLIVVALGILLSVAGFLYAGFVGGIPGPDDSPAEAAHVSLHNEIGFRSSVRWSSVVPRRNCSWCDPPIFTQKAFIMPDPNIKPNKTENPTAALPPEILNDFRSYKH